MTLKGKLDKKLKLVDNLDYAWVIFITDQVHHLRKNANVLSIDDAVRSVYLHKLEHFLLDNNVDMSVYWIVRLMNDLNLFEDFTKLSYILVPNRNDVTNLYRKYQTSRLTPM
jgi:hypothetical protein